MVHSQVVAVAEPPLDPLQVKSQLLQQQLLEVGLEASDRSLRRHNQQQQEDLDSNLLNQLLLEALEVVAFCHKEQSHLPQCLVVVGF